MQPPFIWVLLEILLLGGLWVFALIWLPFFQHQFELEPVYSSLLVEILRAHSMFVLSLSAAMLIVAWFKREASSGIYLRHILFLTGFLFLAGLLLVAIWLDVTSPWSEVIVIIQAVAGLYYFVVGRLKRDF